jgi:hypothetical protein
MRLPERSGIATIPEIIWELSLGIYPFDLGVQARCRRTAIAKRKAIGTRQPNAIPEKTARRLVPRPESGSLPSNT